MGNLSQNPFLVCNHFDLIISINYFVKYCVPCHTTATFIGQFSQQLATKVMQIQSKRYFIDVKQNNKTKYFKLSEVYIF